MGVISKRQKEILNLILDCCEYISPKDLCKKLNVSTRTIRNDISQINTLNNNPIIGIAKSKGYYIIEKSIASAMLDEYSEDIPVTVEERISYIISKLLYSMDSLDVYDLADELMVSEHTIEKDLIKIKEMLKDNNEKVCMKKFSSKVIMEGSEKEKRSLLCRLILKEQKDNILDINKYEKNFKNIDVIEIDKIIRRYFSKNDIKINDLAVINLVIHVLIVIEKIRNNYELSDIYDYEDVINKYDLEISNEICNEVEKSVNVSIPKKEREYIALLISGKRIFIHTKSNDEKSEKVRAKIRCFMEKVIDKLHDEYLLDLKEDLSFVSSLTLHMENLLIRCCKGISIQNPLIYTTKKVYPLIYDMGISIALEYENEFGYILSDDEIGLIVLHLAAAIEQLNYRDYKINCLIICPTTVSTSNLLKNKLLKLYSDRINIVGCISISELEKFKESEIDLIISPIALNHKLNVKTIICSTFLLKEDIKKIDNAIKSFDYKSSSNEILNMFDSKLFFKDIKLEDRLEVIKYLSENLSKMEYCPKEYVDYVIKRENTSCTAYGGLLAIPHPVEKIAYENKIAVGILKEPIMWGEYKVQVVLLFCLNSNKKLNLEKLFEQLIKLVENQDTMKSLINSKGYDDFINKFMTIGY